MSGMRGCKSCWRDIPDGTKRKYCSDACRQRAYRRRRFNTEWTARENRELAEIELVNAMADVLAPDRIESYSPETRYLMRRTLKRALKSIAEYGVSAKDGPTLSAPWA